MNPPLAIVGTTASGKSALAMAVARARPGVELVSVDSMQLYRGMDIGTAKPNATERAEVAHHLIDLYEPAEEVTLVRYLSAYREALHDIAGRDAIAVLVGGTALYLRAVLDGLTPPGRWPEIRAELEAAADLAALHRRLVELDPVAAAKVEVGNRRRIVRALEVCLGAGRPFSSFGAGLDQYPPTATRQVALTWSRSALTQRIAHRVDEQLAAGWLAEVAALADRPRSRTAAQALGYAELSDHLAGRLSLEAARELIITHTRQFAVRQEKWFRRDPRVEWLDPLGDPVGSVLEHLELPR